MIWRGFVDCLEKIWLSFYQIIVLILVVFLTRKSAIECNLLKSNEQAVEEALDGILNEGIKKCVLSCRTEKLQIQLSR